MNRKQLRARLSERGMTLVELVVVIAVVGILVAVSSPSIFGAIRRERERALVNDVANVFREARNQAMARGEAVGVVAFADSTGATGGYIRTLRFLTQLPGGGHQIGTIACNVDTEDISTDDCPVGATCAEGDTGGRCWSPAMRSCRQVYGGYYPIYVSRYEADQRSSSGIGIREATSTTGGGVCFNPDGSAVSWIGYPHSPWSAWSACPGEGYRVWLATRDPAVSINTIVNATRCGNTADQYESVNGYVIRVNHNGEVALRSPQ